MKRRKIKLTPLVFYISERYLQQNEIENQFDLNKCRLAKQQNKIVIIEIFKE